MESSIEALDREIQELKAKRQPVSEKFERISAALKEIDAEIKNCEDARAARLGTAPNTGQVKGPHLIKKKQVVDDEVWPAVHAALKKSPDREMTKQEIVDALEPLGYTSKQVGLSLKLCIRPGARDEIRLIRSGRGKKIDLEEVISFPTPSPG